SPGSIMPKYPWLLEDDLDISNTEAKINVMIKLGVPYPEDYAKIANDDLLKQAEGITAGLEKSGVLISPNKEIIALIAYLQRMGTDIKVSKDSVKTSGETIQKLNGK